MNKQHEYDNQLIDAYYKQIKEKDAENERLSRKLHDAQVEIVLLTEKLKEEESAKGIYKRSYQELEKENERLKDGLKEIQGYVPKSSWFNKKIVSVLDAKKEKKVRTIKMIPKNCVDKERAPNDECKYPTGTCEHCKNFY